MQTHIPDPSFVAAHHEAGHVVAAWRLGIPIGFTSVDEKGNGVTRVSQFHSCTSMFRAVTQCTVRNMALFALAGDAAEQLVTRFVETDIAEPDYAISWFLARKFRLDLAQLKEEAEQIILREHETIVRIASELHRRRSLNSFDLALQRMNWLARGK